MAPLKLHSTALSYNSLRVDLVLAEKGLRDVVEIVPADFFTAAHKVCT